MLDAIATPRLYTPSKPHRNAAYLNWIRTLPCIVCGAKAEAAHTGLRGFGQRADDYQAIPLCSHHHRTAADSYHSNFREFCETHGLNLARTIQVLNAEYNDQHERTIEICKAKTTTRPRRRQRASIGHRRIMRLFR